MGEGGERRGEIRRYYCEYCGICRSKKTLITAHIASHHKEDLEKKDIDGGEGKECRKSNVCEECGVSFKKPAHLTQHMQSHSLKRPFVCPVNDCSSSYRRKDHLNRHLLQHEGKLFKCLVENCNQEFTVKSNMKRHLSDIHDGKAPADDIGGQKRHVCQESGCGKEFKYLSRLQKHEDSHVKLESTEVICADPDCEKTFTNVECLKAHNRSCHQRIICEACGSKHLRKNIKRHLRTHQDHSPERIKCTFKGCDHTFTTNSNLQKHIKAVHHNLKPFACRVGGCGMRFPFKHVRDKHENSSRHVYAPGNLEESDERVRTTRSVGGRKRKYPSIETLTRKRVVPPSQSDGVLNESSEYLSWLMSSDVEDM